MNSKANANVIVLIIVILLALGLAGGTLYFYQKEHDKNSELTSKLDELGVKQKIAEAKLLEAQKSIATLEDRLKDSVNQIDALSVQLQQEKSAKEEALAKVEQVKNDLNQQKESRSDLEQRLNKAQEEAKALQTKLDTIETEKSKLEAKIKDFESKSKVELGKIVVGSEQGAQVSQPSETAATQTRGVKKTEAAGSEGKVLVLNKEYNFVVINLGSKDGIGIGDVFSLFHADKYIGDVKVEKVQDVMSAAGFLSEETKNKAREGDRVVKNSK